MDGRIAASRRRVQQMTWAYGRLSGEERAKFQRICGLAPDRYRRTAYAGLWGIVIMAALLLWSLL